jgi:hypothetical protein
MAPPSERYVLEFARLASSGVPFAPVAPCGESRYDVGVGGPGESAGVKVTQAGGGSVARAGAADIRGRSGTNTSPTAARSSQPLGGTAGIPVSISASRGTNYGGTNSSVGNSGSAGDGPGSGGNDPTKLHVEETNGQQLPVNQSILNPSRLV